jgi:hypothetical protein
MLHTLSLSLFREYTPYPLYILQIYLYSFSYAV